MEDNMLELAPFDVGGLEIEELNLADFDLQNGYDEETRYCKPKLYALRIGVLKANRGQIKKR